MLLEADTSAFNDASNLQDRVALVGDLAERIQVVEADVRLPSVQVDDHMPIIAYRASPCPG